MLRSDAEATPAEAGQLLGLSRQFIDRLVEAGSVPARRLPGTHRTRPFPHHHLLAMLGVLAGRSYEMAAERESVGVWLSHE